MPRPSRGHAILLLDPRASLTTRPASDRVGRRFGSGVKWMGAGAVTFRTAPGRPLDRAAGDSPRPVHAVGQGLGVRTGDLMGTKSIWPRHPRHGVRLSPARPERGGRGPDRRRCLDAPSPNRESGAAGPRSRRVRAPRTPGFRRHPSPERAARPRLDQFPTGYVGHAGIARDRALPARVHHRHLAGREPRPCHRVRRRGTAGGSPGVSDAARSGRCRRCHRCHRCSDRRRR